MKQLNQLLATLGLPSANSNAVIERIVFDSRLANENTLFVAIKGGTSDGHNYLTQVQAQGCKYAIVEHAGSAAIQQFVVEDSRKALAVLACEWFGHPSKYLSLVGITGTNGKTTTATLLYNLFQRLGYKTGLLSTVVNKIGDEAIPSTHTTPDPFALNELLRTMVDAGCTHCFMEVSSHAVHQQRIHGLVFEGAVFTNITHDHLDYHQTFAEYIKAKKNVL